jgi:hypothetical protein
MLINQSASKSPKAYSTNPSILTYNTPFLIERKMESAAEGLSSMENKFNSMQSQVQLLISTLVDSDQTTKNELARKMLQKGIYKPTSQ